MTTRLIADRYEPVRSLGKGSTGKVLLAQDRVLGIPVALKGLSPAAGARLKEEFLLLAPLRHPGLCRVLDFGYQGPGTQRPFLISEYVPGEHLGKIRLSPGAELPFAEGLLSAARQLLGALAYLHRRGIVHGDIKPANVLQTADNRIRVVDFHLSSLLTRPSEARGGTLLFLSPERLTGDRQEPSFQDDLFAAGVTLYAASTGRLPGGGRQPLSIAQWYKDRGPLRPGAFRDDLAPSFAKLITALTEPAAEDRVRSAPEALAILGIDTSLRPAVDGWTHFVGRRNAQDVLCRQASQRTKRHGRALVAAVTGPPGSGKTRLLNASVPQWKVQGFRVVALWDARQSLEGLASELRISRKGGKAAARRLLEALRRCPTALLLDNVVWSCWEAFVKRLVYMQGPPLIVAVGLCAGEAPPELCELSVHLSGLSRESVQQLLCDFSRAEEVDPELLDELIERSGALPGRLLSIARQGAASGSLWINEAGVLEKRRPLPPEQRQPQAVPDHLGPFLAVMEAFGRPIAKSVLLRALGPARRHLYEEALQRGFLSELAGEQATFVGATSGGVGTSVPPSARLFALRLSAAMLREGSHLPAGEILSLLPGTEERVCRCALRAARELRETDPAAAFRALCLLFRSTPPEDCRQRFMAALRVLQGALAAGRPVPREVRDALARDAPSPLAECCAKALLAAEAEREGRLNAALRLVRDAANLRRRASPWPAVRAELLSRLGWLSFQTGRRKEAEAYVRTALSLPPAEEESPLFRCYVRAQSVAASTLALLGKDKDADEILARLRTYRSVPPALLLRPLTEKAIRAAEKGLSREADQTFKKVFHLARTAGDRTAQIGAAINRAILAYKERKLPKAEDLFKRALKLSLRWGEGALRPAIWCGLATCRRLRGNFNEAVAGFREVLKQKEVRGGLTANTLVNLGEVYQLLGAGRKALSLRRRAVAKAEELGDPYLKGLAAFGLACTQGAEGLNPEHAASRAEQYASERKDWRIRSGSMCARGLFWETQGAREAPGGDRLTCLQRACRCYGKALAYASVGKDSDYRAVALLGIFRVLLRCGALQKARRVLQRFDRPAATALLPWEVQYEKRLWELFLQSLGGAEERVFLSLVSDVSQARQCPELEALSYFLLAAICRRVAPSTVAYVPFLLRARSALRGLELRKGTGGALRVLDAARSVCPALFADENLPWASLLERLAVARFELYATTPRGALLVAGAGPPFPLAHLKLQGDPAGKLQVLRLSGGAAVIEKGRTVPLDLLQAMLNFYLLAQEHTGELLRRIRQAQGAVIAGSHAAETETIQSRAQAAHIARHVAHLQHKAEGRFAGRRGALGAILRKLPELAASGLPVLLTGESGTGKDLIARTIHRFSLAQGPFVVVGCADLPESLVEAELFGVCKGAFTGADRDRPGLLEQASEGTLYLDAVDAIPPHVQAALLRVLESGDVRPVGGTETRQVSFRLIAASRLPLPELKEVLREDFYWRLSAMTVAVPPLRDCKEDLPEIVAELLRRWAAETGRSVPRISEAGLGRLKDHTWPGNVRELANCLTRALLRKAETWRQRGPLVLEGEDFSFQEPPFSGYGTKDIAAGDLREVREAAERDYLRSLLEHFRGSVTACAQRAGVSRRHLRNLLKKHGLNPAEFRESQRAGES